MPSVNAGERQFLHRNLIVQGHGGVLASKINFCNEFRFGENLTTKQCGVVVATRYYSLETKRSLPGRISNIQRRARRNVA